MERGFLFNIEGGVNIKIFWKLGFYGNYKYVYANKEKNNKNVIDFSEHILLLVLRLTFGYRFYTHVYPKVRSPKPLFL